LVVATIPIVSPFYITLRLEGPLWTNLTIKDVPLKSGLIYFVPPTRAYFRQRIIPVFISDNVSGNRISINEYSVIIAN